MTSMLCGTARLSLLCAIAVLCFTGCSWVERTTKTPPPAAENRAATDVLLPFGNPSGAYADPGNHENYLVTKRSFAISYNDRRGTANWVAWRTTAADLGETIPRPQFEPDPDLPRGFGVINPSYYSRSGYDRGHLIPSADRFADRGLNADTFLMTNIAPQAKGLNQYPWEKLERYARGIVRRGDDIYTIAGVYGEQGRLKGRITVPTNFWKVIVVLPHGSNEISEATKVIAVDMPNSGSVASANWQKYLTTARAIEQKTGYNFLSALRPEVQDAIETRPDVHPNASR
jgi:endonuclease G, mitochondrial